MKTKVTIGVYMTKDDGYIVYNASGESYWSNTRDAEVLVKQAPKGTKIIFEVI